MKLAGVANGNVTVRGAVDQENGSASVPQRECWRDRPKVKAVPRSCIQKSDLDDGPGKEAAMETVLVHAIERDLLEGGKWAIGGDRPKWRFARERLKEYGCAHRLAGAVQAADAGLATEQPGPLADVVHFEQTIGDELAPSHSVSAGVGRKYRITGLQ